MIEGRPRESLVLYDNAIEVSPHFLASLRLYLTSMLISSESKILFRLLAVLILTTLSRSHLVVSLFV